MMDTNVDTTDSSNNADGSSKENTVIPETSTGSENTTSSSNTTNKKNTISVSAIQVFILFIFQLKLAFNLLLN